MEELSYKSFAKINIGLNIVSKRDDGYHNLETIFYPIKLHDTLSFKKSNKLIFQSNSELINSDKDNLILKAISYLENYSDKEILVEIILKKNIPIGAGLGGGSSNAAFTLLAINKLFDLNISIDKLRDIGLKLGSDVPLFLFDLPAYAESRGEKLSKVDIKIPHPILIVNPNIHISTSWAFSKISPIKPQSNLKEIVKKYQYDYNYWRKFIKNDFEEVVLNQYSELLELKKLFYLSKADFSIMTGSGSTFFAIYKNESSLNQAAEIFKQKNYFVYVEKPN
jgi:4-diphosphocytidyl-2-C-methyl-D-erythritol kinase